MNSEERREVAARLRGVTEEELSYAFLGEIINFTVGGRCLDDEGDIDERLILNRLADLINPTCRMRPVIEGFRCSACGTYHDMSGFEEFPWPFCPNCGARVVTDDD